jgi:hypothetical protein
MCGPARDDEKRKAAQEEFAEEFSSACFETFRKDSIFSASAPLRILDSDEQTISVSAPLKSRRGTSKKNRRAIWIQ